VPVLGGRLEPVGGGAWRGRRAVAFAGIGRPERFFATLRDLGAEVLEAVPLADHAPVPPALLDRLEARARREGASLACTEKDAMRLPTPDRGRVTPLPVRMALDWGPLDAAFERLGL
jgi:tetraacyldisaccharide 4'-kinase